MTVTQLREYLQSVERRGLGQLEVTYDGGYGTIEEPAVTRQYFTGKPCVILNAGHGDDLDVEEARRSDLSSE